ncbi:hypothetical protein NN561_011651 [Cricetulus griseus]
MRDHLHAGKQRAALWLPAPPTASCLHARTPARWLLVLGRSRRLCTPTAWQTRAPAAPLPRSPSTPHFPYPAIPAPRSLEIRAPCRPGTPQPRSSPTGEEQFLPSTVLNLLLLLALHAFTWLLGSLLCIDKEMPSVLGRLLRPKKLQAVNKMNTAQILMKEQIRCSRMIVKASETLQRSPHSSAAAELALLKQQVHEQQQELEQQYHLLKDYQKKKEELKNEITILQEKIEIYDMEQDKKLEHANDTLREKQAIIDDLHERKTEEEKKSAILHNQLESIDKLVADLKEQLTERDQENQSLKLELASSKEKENHCLLEIKQFMGIVEELQQKNYNDILIDTGTEQSTKREARRKLDHLQVELDEMYGREIMHMKEELIQQHESQLEDLQSHHKDEMETALASYASTAVNMCNLYKQYKEQLDIFKMVIRGQNIKLQDTISQKENLSKELLVVKREQHVLQSQYNNLLEEYNILRQQTTRDQENIVEPESKLNDTRNSLHVVADLKAKITAVSELRKKIECKHRSAEITSCQIKLEMLEKEKNEILKRMSESQEMQMQQLRKHLLISQEEALCKANEDLEVEHRTNIEKLKDNLAVHHKHQIEELENEINKKIEMMQCEKENLTSHDKEPLQVLIGRLQKAVSEECRFISKELLMGIRMKKLYLKEKFRKKTCIIGHLEQELLRLPELEEEQQQVQEKRELLSRQKEAMRAVAGPVEQCTN